PTEEITGEEPRKLRVAPVTVALAHVRPPPARSGDLSPIALRPFADGGSSGPGYLPSRAAARDVGTRPADLSGCRFSKSAFSWCIARRIRTIATNRCPRR